MDAIARRTPRVQNLPKSPPHSIEAEQSVIGGLLLRNDIFADVARMVGPNDFYRTDHIVLFEAISEMLLAHQRCDFLTLTERLRDRARLDEAGGSSYIGLLASENYSIANLVSYAGIVREHAVKRRIIAAAADLGDMGYNPLGMTADELLEKAERIVFDLRQNGSSRQDDGPRPVEEFIAQSESEVERLHNAGGGMGGFSTGFTWVDEKLDGLHPGDLVIVAGRPGDGKSTFALNVAEHVSMQQGGDGLVAFFSMEMQGKQLALRTLANIGRVNLQALRSGRLNDQDWERLTAASAIARRARLVIDETGSLSPMDLRSRSRRLAARGKLKLIVVDYIQLMQVPNTKENRTNEVSHITRSLKAIAKELGVPIIALSQLSRANEKDNRKPKLSDLRDSGGIEQDADAVLFVWRPPQLDDDEDTDGVPPLRTSEIICGKQRQGPLGSHRMKFEGQFCRFIELSPYDEGLLRQQQAKRSPANGFGKLAKMKDGKARAAGDA